MGEALERGRRRDARAVNNEEFLQRLMARRPDAEARYLCDPTPAADPAI